MGNTVNKLNPETAKVNDGATVLLWSDCHAGTIIRVTPKMIVIQRDKATLNPDWKPEIIPGGFVGHCTNQNSQNYTYERDTEGEIYKLYWSEKYGYYGKPYGFKAFAGRHEFYDYNF